LNMDRLLFRSARCNMHYFAAKLPGLISLSDAEMLTQKLRLQHQFAPAPFEDHPAFD
jgi:hypothetical protein